MTESGTGDDPGATGNGGGWTAPVAPPPAPVAGAAGMVYADVPNRAVAYIIDAIILAVIGFVVAGVLGGVGLQVVTFDLNNGFQYNYLASAILALVSAAIGGIYFVYTWTKMRGTVGMKVLGMQIGQAKDGATLTQDQAIRRWVALGAPLAIAQAFNPIPLFGFVIGIASIGWFVYLLYTTSQSPTKQGFHDTFVGSAVVKAARAA